MDGLTAYLAAEGCIDELERKLGAVESRHGRLLTLPGPAAPASMGCQCLARPAADHDRIDFGRGDPIARDPAQLGGLCAALLPTGGAHPGAAKQGLSQAPPLRN